MITNMTQEDKELLLEDLSARLPYGVFCNMGLDYPLPLQRLFVDKLDGILLDFYEDGTDYQVYLSEVKPYLRPMSSMTEEEYGDLCVHCSWMWHNDSKDLTKIRGDYKCYDWLNKHHFDYRGLIEKELALEAPEGMYNIKEK